MPGYRRTGICIRPSSARPRKLHRVRWSLAFACETMSKSFAEEARVRDGSNVEITLKDRTLVVVAISTLPTLKKLLTRITSKNLHRETDTGSPQGHEVW